MVDYLININKIIIFFINAIGIWLAIWVYFSNPKQKPNKIFLCMTVFTLLWIDFRYLGATSQGTLSLFFYKLNFGAVALFFIAAYLFSVFFPREEKRHSFLDKFIIFLGVVFFFLSVFTNLIIKNIEIREWGNNIIMGKVGNIFYIVITLLTFLILLKLFKKYFILSKQDKLRIQYFLVGISLFAICNIIFNIILPAVRGTVQYYQFGDYSAIFLFGFTAYAIVKRELFEIKVVLTGLFVALIAILLTLDTFVFTSQMSLQILKGAILVIFLYFGYLMIKSVISEIQRREEVERLSKAKTEFISIASHQLRTPLTAIKGYMSMIIEGTYGKVAEKIKRPMENVYKSNERLIKLVNDLLSVSRIESGRIQLKPEKTSLESIILIAVQELKNEAEKKGLALKWRKPSKALPKILIDRDQIRQVILNVVDNAIRYTNKGAVSIEANCLQKTLLIKISDTGAGMTKEEISYLFESFSRGKAGARLWTEGAGLGLYVAKKFVELHNGKIWAESKGKSKGSSFYIELPIK